ncbi:unnamed protein product [Alopecurus aequalis]
MQPLPLHFLYSRKLTFLGLVLVLLIFLASPTSSCTEQEKGSLLQFLSGLSQDGGLAASWKPNGTDCCGWEGITCDVDGAVTDVSLALKGLEGQVSLSLGNLAGLLRLNLSHNSLTGGLPLELVSSGSIIFLDVSFNQLDGEMQELPSSTPARPLQVLNISSNLLTGQFPSSTTWEVMNNLVSLNASNNSFTGQIPSHFCSSSPSFAVLDLCYNKFTGSIPLGLGNCHELRVLKAGHNNLNGTLPNELFNAFLLEYLSLPDNDIHGVLSGGQIIKLRNLVTLDLGGNKFSGNIPDSIGELKMLEELHLNNNNMSGELPPALSNCTDLITINLKSNNFSGELSKVNFSTLPKLETLDLLYNNFTGTVPETLYTCSNLTALRLSGNNLHGQLSPRIGDLKHLTFLSLAMNSFTNITNALQILKSCTNLKTLLMGRSFRGELMPEDDFTDGFDNLQILALNDCSLVGKMPFWISKLANLEMLILNNNQLAGSIPAWTKDLKNLLYLDISNNSLTGEIPPNLMDMPMLQSDKTKSHLDPRIFELPVYKGASLQYRMPIAFPKVLDLSNNKLTGEIPQEIGKLKSLFSLNLSSNDLTGQIPISVCNLTNLLLLDLSNNNLTGAIPAALNSLHFLSSFNVSNNDLEGSIPSGGQFETFQNSSFDGNPKLCGPMVDKKCAPAFTPPATVVASKQTDYKVPFVIAFTAFFGVGVLYDQAILSRYFG